MHHSLPSERREIFIENARSCGEGHCTADTGRQRIAGRVQTYSVSGDVCYSDNKPFREIQVTPPEENVRVRRSNWPAASSPPPGIYSIEGGYNKKMCWWAIMHEPHVLAQSG